MKYNMNENKTKASQIKASVEYDKRKDIITIACKVTKDKKEIIEKHYKNKGYKSMSEYLFALIDNDINSKN